jgi:hypothetical protein
LGTAAFAVREQGAGCQGSRFFAAQGQTSFVLPRAKFTTWHPGLTGLQTPLMLHVICCPDVIV